MYHINRGRGFRTSLEFWRVNSMKMAFAKSLLAVSVLAMSTVPAYAGKITSPAYLTPVSATVDMDFWGPFATASVPCQVIMNGVVQSGTSDFISFSTVSSTCDADISKATADSWTQVSMNISINTPVGPCNQNNVPLLWSSPTAIRPSIFTVGGICKIENFIMTISPTLTII